MGTKLSLQPVVLHRSLDEAERLLTRARPELALMAAWAVQSRVGSAHPPVLA